MSKDAETVPEALVIAGVHYARRDYNAAERAILGALSGVRKERDRHRRNDEEVRVRAE